MASRRDGLGVDSLIEEWLKTYDDSILDVIKASDQDFIKGAFAPRTGIKEAYRSGSVTLDVYFRVHHLDRMEWQTYRARSVAKQGFLDGDLAQWNAIDSPRDLEQRAALISPNNSQGSVFVSVTERIQDGQGVYCRAIPSLVWLQLMDEFPSMQRNSLQPTTRILDVVLTVDTDWETPPTTRRVGITNSDQSADQIVERGTKVVKELSDDDAGIEGDARRAFNPPNHPNVASIWIGFQDDLVFCRLKEAINVTVNGVQMMVCPLDTGINGSQPNAHD